MLTRFNYLPLGDLQLVQRGMNRWFDQALSNFWGDDLETTSTFVPPVDVRETPDTLEFTAEVPGFEKDEIDIRVDQGNLILSGERKFEQEAKEENYHRIERSYGKFQRTFALPSSVDADRIKATLKNGVLHVTLPKSEKAKPRQIPVSTN
ncbi:MAG TPA: Hsp20/alpha crystallin family protein [Acidobacteriota bacterium]|jgi:HSP20 family protein